MASAFNGKKRYEIERSPLYLLSSKRKLAVLLGLDLSAVTSLDKSELTTQYNIFKHKETLRFITEPVGDLVLVHKRLLKLFVRIAPPEYVHSAIKKRSYKTNAAEHVEAANVLKIDIKKFFPSVKFHCIHSFFQNSLRCSPDIATILAKLCTVETRLHGVHLPTGSCISPILSFLANRRLFDAIKRLCDEQGCIFTLYVDDVTISGRNASRALLSQVAVQIHNHGYGYHKIKTYQSVPVTVTGIVLSNGRMSIPHCRAKLIREVAKALNCANGPIKATLLASLVGRLSEAEQIDPAYRTQRNRVLEKYSTEWKQITTERIKKAKAKQRKKIENLASKAETL